MRGDRFQKAAKVAEVAALEDELRGRGLRRRAQLHFQDGFFLGVMMWAVKEQKTGNLSPLAADLVSQWNALTTDQRDRGDSVNENRWW